jgi:hypothetical protein
MKRLFLIPILLAAGYFAFRYYYPDRTGLYVSEDQTELSLLPNKMAVLKPRLSTNAQSGTYQINNGSLYLQFGANDVRRLEIQDSGFVYDPDARMRQPTPEPGRSNLTPAEEARYQQLKKELGFDRPAATPRPKQTFRRSTPQ